MTIYKGITATVVYTVEIPIDLEEEFMCEWQMEQAILEMALSELQSSIAPDPSHEEVRNLKYEEVEEEE
jgi:hypothetical protein